MKNQIRNLVMGAGFAALLWIPTAQAADKLEAAEIPFDFHVANMTLPAGDYSVMQGAAPGTLRLRSNETGKSIYVVPAGRALDNGYAKLVFNRYGDNYFLSAICIPETPGYVFGKNDTEKALAAHGDWIAVAVPLTSR